MHKWNTQKSAQSSYHNHMDCICQYKIAYTGEQLGKQVYLVLVFVNETQSTT